MSCWKNDEARKSCWRGRLSVVDRLILTRLDQLLLVFEYYLPFYQTSYLNEEVNCTKPSPQLVFPEWSFLLWAANGRWQGQETRLRGYLHVRFALSLPVYKTNNTFIVSKRNLLIAESCSEIGRVNKPLQD